MKFSVLTIRSKLIVFIILSFTFLVSTKIKAQGFNHTWLLGYSNSIDTNTTSSKARINFNLNNFNIVPESRKMKFDKTQSNISDVSGNFLMASNGCWIMDASNDTMLNGAGLNPNSFTDTYCNGMNGLPLPNGNLFLPYPEDVNKYILFHMTGNYSGLYLNATEVYYSIVDMQLNGGLGGVIQKNIVAFQDTLAWGISACRHANGRDWWIVAIKDSSTLIYKILLTPTGITSISTQNLGFSIPYGGNATQPTFSPDGTKFAYTTGIAGANSMFDVRLFSFDRCSGIFDTLAYISKSNEVGFSLAFSSNSKYLYYASTLRLYQLNSDTTNIVASDTLIDVYDGYSYPFNPTNFWLMYRAANGKIYLTSGGPVIDLHYINYPDSSGLSCDFHQHDLHLPCYHWASVPNHPNYYLGCDTSSNCSCLTGISDEIEDDFGLSISPNPTFGEFNVIYQLPKNKSGKLEIFESSGRLIYSLALPPWSTFQQILLPENISGGVYNCIINSGKYRTYKKLVVVKGY